MEQEKLFTGAGSLVDRLIAHPGFKETAGALRRGDDAVDITGLRGSSVSLFAAALHECIKRTIVVCVPEQEQAEDLLSDLKTISAARSSIFPEKEVHLHKYEYREKASLRGDRNRCLDLIQRNRVDIVVTSLLGFVEKTIPAESLQQSKIHVTGGGSIDLEEFRAGLSAIGYDASPLVEEAGQFAVRGGIVDIFDPAWESPLRMELSGDRVESLRLFDIDSQRSIKTIEAGTILPATGVLLSEGYIDELERFLRDLDFADSVIDHIKTGLEHSRNPRLLRKYAPAIGMNGSLLDYFAEPPVIVFLNMARMKNSYDEMAAAVSGGGSAGGDEYPVLDFSSYVHPFAFYEDYKQQSVRIGPVGSGCGADSKEKIEFRTDSHPSFAGKLDELIKNLRKLRGRGLDIYLFSEGSAQRERLADMLDEDERMVHLPVGWITSGFIWDEIKTAVLTDHEIFHRILPRPARRGKRRKTLPAGRDHLKPGDYVVHVDFGIGRFIGLEKVTAGGAGEECLSIRYLGGDRIFVPVEQMDLVGKYIGSEGAAPPMDRLGSGKWLKTREKTKKAVEDAAQDLLQLYAEREIADGFAFEQDTQWQKGLEASFPYEETPDQLQATDEIKCDMESPRPMDRVVCGDVGYGKTEVAIRAAFKAATGGKQVAILVPTTILAMQHFKTFEERLSPYPVRIEMLSRFKSRGEQKKIIEDMKTGVVDIVIGTHRLLSEDVSFRDLGLLVIDEEHRFGVKSKEKLKRLKKGVDVLTLTATPIPRTLYMALSGLRGVSLIETPPRNRHPVKTEIAPFDEEKIVNAVKYEISRGGQVFFVHNRVASIYSMQAFLEKLLPGIRFCAAHGQMNEIDLEKAILEFLDKKYDVLVSTMIIESGLDFPDVNTIIVNRADRLGLAQLYQLRGRVGRRERQAYAYLFVPSFMSPAGNAGKRLQAMEEFEELGSGYRLAMRDLEIRGAGNVLGVEQHGHIAAVGFDMYCKMLKNAVEKTRGASEDVPAACKVEAAGGNVIPRWYIEEQDERMRIYKKIAGFTNVDEVDSLESEIEDRFGKIPPEAVNLLEMTRIKILGAHLGMGRIRIRDGKTVMEMLEGRTLAREQCASFVETFPGRLMFKSHTPFGVIFAPEPGISPAFQVRKLLMSAYDCDK